MLAPRDLVQLLERVGQGDRAAFRALYGATSAKLYGVVLRILRRRDMADDILQDAFVAIWQNAKMYDPQRSSPITWMVTIARNRAIDEVRRRRTVSLDEAPEVQALADPARPASDMVELADETRRLSDCLEQLGEERRQIVRLAYLEGLSRQELADRFGHPVATIKTWLHRSLKQLKDCLGR